MATYDYSKIAKEIRKEVEAQIQEEISEIDLAKIFQEIISEYNIDLGQIDIKSTEFKNTLTEVIKKTFNSAVKEIPKTEIDLDDFIDLDEKSLKNKIKDLFDSLENLTGRESKEFVKNLEEDFVKAVSVGLGKNFKIAKKALDNYNDLLHEQNDKYRLDKDEDVIIDSNKLNNGITAKANRLQKLSGQVQSQVKDIMKAKTQLDEVLSEWQKETATLTNERFTAFNSSTLKTSGIHAAADAEGVSGELIRTAINELGEEADSFIHSHPKKYAAFSDNDIVNFFKLLESGIKNQVVTSSEQFMSLEMDKVNSAKKDDIIQEIQSRFNIVDDKFDDLIISNFRDKLQKRASEVFNKPHLDIHPVLLNKFKDNYNQFISNLQDGFSNNDLFEGYEKVLKQSLQGTNLPKNQLLSSVNALKNLSVPLFRDVQNYLDQQVQLTYQKELIEVFNNPDFAQPGAIKVGKLQSFINNLVKKGFSGAIEDINITDTTKELTEKIAEDINKSSTVLEKAGKMVGKDASESIAKGIIESKDEVAEAVKEVVETAADVTAEMQDSNSPSVVAEKLGEYWGEGYANGIKKHKNDVESSIKELVVSGILTTEDLQKDLNTLLSGGFGKNYKALTEPLQNILKPITETENISQPIVNSIEQASQDIVMPAENLGEKIGESVKDGIKESIEEIPIEILNLQDNLGRDIGPKMAKNIQGTVLVDELGRVITLYHDTFKDFEKFDISKIRYGRRGIGAYLSPDLAWSEAGWASKEHGGKTTQWYANVRRIFDTKTDQFTDEEIESIITQFLQNQSEEYKQQIRTLLQNPDWTKKQGALYDIAQKNGFDRGNWGSILSSIGIDGVFGKTSPRSSEYVIFDPDRLFKVNKALVQQANVINKINQEQQSLNEQNTISETLSKNLEQTIEQVKQPAKEIGKTIKEEIVNSTTIDEDDIEAYLAQLDAKVTSNLDLSTKEPSIDMSDAGEEVRKNKKEVKELQQETEKAKDSMSKVMELWKEFGTPSDALDTGGFARVREVLDYLGGKFSEMNDKADDFTERKLNAEFFRELIEQLDLSEDKLNVIKHLIFEIEAIEPGGKYEHLASNKKGQAAIINSKRSYKMLDDIRDIINGVRDVTQEEINTANLIMGIESPISNTIEEVTQSPISEEIVQTEQQLTETTERANAVIDEQKQKISELEEQVDDLRSSLKAQGDELAHANEEYGNAMDELDRSNTREDLISEELTNERLKREEIEEQNKALKEQNELLEQHRKEAEADAKFYEEMSHIAAGGEAEADKKMRLEVEARQEAEKQLDIKKEENEELKKKLDLTEQIVNESKTKETKVDSEEVSNIKAVQNAIKKKNNAFKTEEKTVDKSVTNEINKLKELEKVISENIPNAINKKDSAFIGEKEIVKQVVDEEKKTVKQPASKATTEKAKPVSNDSLIKAYNVQFEKLKKAVTSDKNIITDEIKEFYETLSGKDIKLESSDAIKQYTENIKQFLDTIEKRGNETKLLKNINDATSTLQKNSAMPKRLAKDYQQLIDEMKAMSEAGGYTNKQVSEMTNRLIKLDTEFARTGKSGRSFFNMIANDIKTSSARMIAMYFSFQDLIRYARSAVQAVTQLDTALTQLRVVSNASEAELRRVANSAYEMANALGSSTTEITNSITEWRRLGYTIEESQKLAEAAAKLSTGGLMDVNSATTSLISSMQAFKDMGIEAEDIVDQYIYLGK